MTYADSQNQLDMLVSRTRSALDLWLNEPNSKDLQEQFKEANLELLAFSKLQKEACH